MNSPIPDRIHDPVVSDSSPSTQPQRNRPMELLFPLFLLFAWFALQMWILPAAGVPT